MLDDEGTVLDPRCPAEHEGSQCNLLRGHTGPHYIAMADFEWEDE